MSRRRDGTTTSEDRATQLLICETLSLAKKNMEQNLLVTLELQDEWLNGIISYSIAQMEHC